MHGFKEKEKERKEDKSLNYDENYTRAKTHNAIVSEEEQIGHTLRINVGLRVNQLYLSCLIIIIFVF
jgi:proline dehydrogenase